MSIFSHNDNNQKLFLKQTWNTALYKQENQSNNVTVTSDQPMWKSLVSQVQVSQRDQTTLTSGLNSVLSAAAEWIVAFEKLTINEWLRYSLKLTNFAMHQATHHFLTKTCRMGL